MADLSSAISRLEGIASRLERFELGLSGGAAASAASAATSSAAPSGNVLAAYDALAAASLPPLTAAAAALGGEVDAATRHLATAFAEQRKLVALAARAAKPADAAALQALLKPVADEIVAVGALADNRRAKAVQELKVASNAAQALTWLAYAGPSCGMPAPAQHVGEAWNSAEFFANKLLMASRGGGSGGGDATAEWVRSLKELMAALRSYVAAHHAGGLAWNAAGSSVAEAHKAVSGGSGAPAPPPPRVGAPPPPAPPPPPPGSLFKERPGAAAATPAPAKAGGGASMQDVFKQINKGLGGVTGGLRKVTDDMKSKNRADRSGKVADAAPAAGGAAAVAAPAAAPGKGSGKPAGTPRVALEDRRWVVEYQVGPPGGGGAPVVVEVTDPRQAVYVYGCSNAVVQVKGKMNSIALDGCSRTGVVFEDAIAAAEVVNCSAVQVQVTGRVSTLSVDKSDGVQLVVPEALARDANFQVVTAKSSEVNVTVVPADPSGGADAVEHAVPEQFISTFVAGKLVTLPASHGGG